MEQSRSYGLGGAPNPEEREDQETAHVRLGRRASENYRAAVREALARLFPRVSPQRQADQIRRAFKEAFKNAGLKGVVPHDMRRSGIRNFTKAGLGESEGMAISGHKSNSVYKRYNVIDEELQRQSLQRVHERQQREIEQRKVVPIRKAG